MESDEKMIKEQEQKIFGRLENLYNEMDKTWNETASQYGFQCNGCDENCCETEFHHHTLIEKAYLVKGLNKLPRPLLVSVKRETERVQTKRKIAAKKGKSIRIMCPLNQNGKCLVYKFRPMICRLHGIPHEMKKPYSSTPILGAGCKAGGLLFIRAGYIKFDRTPFYLEMASIEKDYQTMLNEPARIKETVAEMIKNS